MTWGSTDGTHQLQYEVQQGSVAIFDLCVLGVLRQTIASIQCHLASHCTRGVPQDRDTHTQPAVLYYESELSLCS
jgi:hypothetical protein